MDTGISVGLLGTVLGLLGGVLGTYFSIKNTRGPRERAFVIRAAAVSWLAIIVLVGGLLLIPRDYRWFLWIAYALLLALGIRHWNRKQAEIRRHEMTSA